MNFRTYILVGIIMAAIMFAISSFFGEGIVAWAQELHTKAIIAGQGGMGQAITAPIIFVMENDLWGALIVVLAWPVVFLWLLLILLLLIIVAGVDVAGDIDSEIRLLRTWWA